MKTKLFNIFGIVLLVMSIISCNNILNKPIVDSGTGSAKLVLKIEGNDSRTIFAPDFSLEEMTYTLKGSKDGADEITIKKSLSYSDLTGGTDIIIDVGTWNFTLEVYKLSESSKSEKRYYSALENVEIVAGENPISFTLIEIEIDRKGGFSVSLTFPEDASVAEVIARLFDTKMKSVSYEHVSPDGGKSTGVCSKTFSIDENSVTYEEDGISSGTYIISFKFFDSNNKEIKPGYSEFVQIKSDRITKAERTLENLERYHTITYNLNDGELKTGTLPASFNEQQSVSLPTENDVSKDGYKLAGWYTDEDFIEDAMTTIPVGTKTDVTLWAKWIPIQYNINYEGLDGAENTNPEIYTIEDEIKLASPYFSTEKEIAFAGWTLNGAKIVTISKGRQGDITLTATWKPGKNFDADNIDALKAWLSKQTGVGPFDVIITGTIKAENITTIANALKVNPQKMVNLDLDGTSDLATIANSAFSGCASLESIVIPNSVNTIGSYAFQNCANLTSITIPSSVTTIGDRAFDGCASLTNVYAGSVESWCGITFKDNGATYSPTYYYATNPLYYAKHFFVGGVEVKNLVISKSVTSIGNYAFYNFPGFESVTIQGGITSFGYQAFMYCKGLKSVEIKSNTPTISSKAFSDCTNLTKVEIGSGTNEIGSNAFTNCTSLTNVTIPSSVTTIGDRAFDGCTSLTNVYAGNVESWCGITFKDNGATYSPTYYYATNPLYYAKYFFVDGVEVKNLVIPASVTSIGNYAFYNFPGFESVTIQGGITSFGYQAFMYCKGLKSVEIKSNTPTISSNAFSNCTNLTKVEIGSGTKEIGSYAFQNCANLTSVTIPSSVTTIGDRAFDGCASLTNVYAGSVESWCGITFKDNGATYSPTYYYATNPLYYAKHFFVGETEVKDFVIPSNIKNINTYTFFNFKGFTSITIPERVTYIAPYAFYGCINVTDVTFENTTGWYYSSSSTATSGTSMSVTNTSTNATNITGNNWGKYHLRTK